MHLAPSALLLPLFVLAAGCGPQNEAASASLCDVETTEFALDEVTPLGFSGTELLVTASGMRTQPGFWPETEAITPLSVSIAAAEGAVAVFYDLEVPPPSGAGPVPLIAVVCEDRVEIEVDVDFSTEDGAFSEAGLSGLLSGDQADLASVSAALDPADLSGSWTPTGFDPADWDTWSISLEGELDAEVVQGAVAIQAERVNGSGPTATAEVMFSEVLQFGGSVAPL